MPEPSASVLALARMRAAGRVSLPESATVLASWSEQAVRAGRHLVEAVVPGCRPVIVLGWLDGSEPVAGGDSGVERSKPPQVLLLTFAAALRACWSDRSEPPFPGTPIDEDAVLDAIASLGPLTAAAIDSGEGSQRHHKGAIRKLSDAGLLNVDGSTIRLGAVVATWSDGQVDTLRAVYDQLPVAHPQETRDEA